MRLQKVIEKGVPLGYCPLGADSKVPAANLPAGSGAAWGGITGTLADQTDLQAALDAKSGLVTITEVEVDLGSIPRYSGKFQITGAGFTAGKAVLVQQAHGPYTGKGTRADEAEMDLLLLTGKVLDATTIDVYWNSQRLVKGNFKFNYRIGA